MADTFVTDPAAHFNVGQVRAARYWHHDRTRCRCLGLYLVTLGSVQAPDAEHRDSICDVDVPPQVLFKLNIGTMHKTYMGKCLLLLLLPVAACRV
jgi:hypothetical protein